MHLYSQLNDFELVDLVKSGDEKAFREVYDRYWDLLYIIARNRLNNEPESEEIVQEIFLDFWSKRDSFELTKGLENYFSVAVKYKVINRLVKKAKVLQYEKEYKSIHQEADNSFLHLLDYKEMKQQLSALIGSLPDKCRRVFQLRHEKGYTLRQIAEEMEISEKTVEAHLTKARKTLRNAIEIPGIVYILVCIDSFWR